MQKLLIEYYNSAQAQWVHACHLNFVRCEANLM